MKGSERDAGNPTGGPVRPHRDADLDPEPADRVAPTLQREVDLGPSVLGVGVKAGDCGRVGERLRARDGARGGMRPATQGEPVGEPFVTERRAGAPWA